MQPETEFVGVDLLRRANLQTRLAGVNTDVVPE